MRTLRDVAAATAVIALFWLTTPVDAGPDRFLQLALAAIAGVACALARRLPLAAAIAATSATATGWILGVTVDPLLLAAPAVYVQAERYGERPHWRWFVGTAAVLGCAVLVLDSAGPGQVLRISLLGVLALGASWMLGVRSREAAVRGAAEARADERARISRDVHDVLSHTLGTIGVRAGVVAHVDAEHPEQLRDVLLDISTQSRDALAELRTLLADDPNAPGPVSRGLRFEMDRIAARARSAHVEVELDFDDAVAWVPAQTATVAYRVVQEAITNAIRHTSARHARIVIRRQDGQVAVSVQDDGGVSSGLSEGNGMRGMRERVEGMGGELTVEADGAGVRIEALLPWSEEGR